MTDKISIKDYQRLSAVTMPKEILANDENLLIFAMGLIGETGEIFEMIKKSSGHGHEFDIDNLSKEIGDVLWYLNAICSYLEIDLSVIYNKETFKSFEIPHENQKFRLKYKSISKTHDIAEILPPITSSTSHLFSKIVSYVNKKEYSCHWDVINLLREDVDILLFSIGNLASHFNLDFSEVAFNNIEKLKKRYPDGFSHNASKNRIE